MKKGVIVILFLLSFSLLSVSGADIASVDGVSWLVAPSNVYEFSEQANLTVFFDQSGSTLQNYNVTYSGISISSIANPSNCVYDNSNSVTSCPSGNLKFSFDALEVTNDTTYIWTVTTNDSNNGIEEWNLTLSVLNDDIAPRITSQTPTSFGYKQNGVFNIVIGYEESESGFEQATLLYKDNSAFVNDVRGSVTADPVSSTCTSTSCTFSFDADTLMGGSDNPYLDAYFNVSDKAGNTNNSELYHLFIDYETPEVKDLSPGDGMLNATNNLDFGFSWDDNSMVTNTVGGFDPQIECEVYINGTLHNSSFYSASESSHEPIYNLTASLADGNYVWFAKCTDLAGLENQTKTTSFTLDTTGPTIILNSPTNSATIINGTLIDLSVSDTFAGVKEVMYSLNGADNKTVASAYDIMTNNWTGGNNTLIVSALDNLSNLNKETYTFTIDNAGPVVTLISPADGNFGNGNFTFSATDVYSTTFSCNLLIDSSIQGTGKTVTNGVVDTFSVSLSDANYGWSVNCTDNVGNQGTTTNITVKIDNTAPLLTITSPSNGDKFAVNTTDVIYSATDASNNLQSCWWNVNGGSNTSIDCSGDINSSIWDQGDNTVKLYANDSAGNLKSTSVNFFVDIEAPVVSLIYPNNNGFGNGQYSFTGTDTYSTNLSCILNLTTGAGVGVNANNDGQVDTFSGIETNFTNTLEGVHTWDVTCTDELGNSGTSTSRTSTLDTTEPSINLSTPLDLSNNPSGPTFTHEVDSDATGDCTYYVYNYSGDLVQQTNAGVSAQALSGVVASNLPYTWNTSCTDTAGNVGWSETSTFYYDNLNPIISNVASSSIGSDTATISWDVDENANNTVYYSTNESNLSSLVLSDEFNQTPSVQLSLSSETLYFFTVQSCDRWNRCINDTITYNFTTSTAPGGSSTSSGGGGGGGNSCARGYEKVNGDCELIVEEVVSESLCTPLWRCNEWSECINGEQTRVCQDWSVCGVSEGKPEETQSCFAPSSELNTDSQNTNNLAESNENNQENPLGVGQATGVFGTVQSNWKPIVAALAILSLLGLGFWKRGPLSTSVGKVVNFRQARIKKEEEEIRKTLRKKGLIK